MAITSLKHDRLDVPVPRLAVDGGRASAHRQAQRQDRQLRDQDFVLRHAQRPGLELSNRIANLEYQSAESRATPSDASVLSASAGSTAVPGTYA